MFWSCQVDLEALRHGFGTPEMDVREIFRIDRRESTKERNEYGTPTDAAAAYLQQA